MTQGIDIPVKIEGNDALVMLARIVNALEGTGRAAAAADPPAKHLGVSLRGIGESARHINEIREFTLSWAHALMNAAERVGELAGQQQRLTAHSARLGLDFERAATAAGGFVSEMQTMQLATALANRNINVTQTELDALARVGMARAASAGKNVEEVFDSIGDSIVEGGEELEKFGSELHRVADDSHTANERLSALVQRGREVSQTMETSADRVARFRNEIERAQRTMSGAFVDELARLQTVGRSFRDGAEGASELRTEMEATGRAAAYTLRLVADLAGIVVGSVAASVRGLTGALQGVWSMMRLQGNSPMDAFRRGTEGAAGDIRDIMAFVDRRVASLMAIGGEGPRTTAPGEAADTRPDLVVSAQSEGIDPVTGRPLRQQRTSGGAGRPRRATIEDLMGRAFERPRAELGARRQEMELSDLERGGIEAAADARRRDAELAQRQRAQSDVGLRERAQAEMAARREDRLLERRFEAQRSFTDRLEDLSYRRITAAQEEAESVNGAFRSMGKAFSDHVTAFAEGREEIGVALQGMLADTLKAIGEESAVKAGLNLAEGFGALATYRYDAAASHFTAAGIYTAVALAAGAAGAALSPQKSAAGKDQQGGADRARSASPAPGASSQQGGGSTVINVAFNGPQFGTGGVVQAARQLAGVINAGAIQGGVQLNRLAIPAGVR